MAERHRLAGEARWKGMTPEERTAASQVARDQRRGKAARLRAIEEELAALQSVPERIAALQAEFDDLRGEPVAA